MKVRANRTKVYFCSSMQPKLQKIKFNPLKLIFMKKIFTCLTALVLSIGIGWADYSHDWSWQNDLSLNGVTGWSDQRGDAYSYYGVTAIQCFPNKNTNARPALTLQFCFNLRYFIVLLCNLSYN